MSLIHLSGVSRSSGKHRAQLSDISLDVSAGEICALIGANGAGKTTLIKAIFDLIAIDSGTIQLNGLPHRETASRRGVSYLPEQFRPPYYLRGGEFISNVARLAGVNVTDEMIFALCDEMELDREALSATIGKYSKGMGQKLGLISSFLCGEKLLVLDEPTSGLDAKARVLLKSKLQALRNRGRGVFLTTHMLADVDALCDRVAIIDRGEMRFFGAPSQFCAAYGSDDVEQAYMACVNAVLN